MTRDFTRTFSCRGERAWTFHLLIRYVGVERIPTDSGDGDANDDESSDSNADNNDSDDGSTHMSERDDSGQHAADHGGALPSIGQKSACASYRLPLT